MQCFSVATMGIVGSTLSPAGGSVGPNTLRTAEDLQQNGGKPTVRYTQGQLVTPVTLDDDFRKSVQERWEQEDEALTKGEVETLLVNSEQRIASLTQRLEHIRLVHAAQVQEIEKEIGRLQQSMDGSDIENVECIKANMELLRQTKIALAAQNTQDLAYVIRVASKSFPQPRPSHAQHPAAASSGASASAPRVQATAWTPPAGTGGSNSGVIGQNLIPRPAGAQQQAIHPHAVGASAVQRPSVPPQQRPIAKAMSQAPPPPRQSPQVAPVMSASSKQTLAYSNLGEPDHDPSLVVTPPPTHEAAMPPSPAPVPAPAYIPSPPSPMPAIFSAQQHPPQPSYGGYTEQETQDILGHFGAPAVASGSARPMMMGGNS